MQLSRHKKCDDSHFLQEPILMKNLKPGRCTSTRIHIMLRSGIFESCRTCMMRRQSSWDTIDNYFRYLFSATLSTHEDYINLQWFDSTYVNCQSSDRINCHNSTKLRYYYTVALMSLPGGTPDIELRVVKYLHIASLHMKSYSLMIFLWLKAVTPSAASYT